MKSKYEFKEVWKEGCLEKYIFKNGKKLRKLEFYDNGDLYDPKGVIKFFIDELNKGDK